jgi:hypothetical protein
MKQQEVFNKIGGIIKELNEQYKYLEANPGKINELELELFVANTHFLTDNAEVLRKINLQNNTIKPVEKAAAKNEEKYFEPLVRQAETTVNAPDDQPTPGIDIAAETPADSYSFIRQEPEVIRHELEIDESWVDDEDEVTNEPEEPVISDQAATIKNSEKPVTEAPQIKPDEKRLTVNQKISAQLGNKAGAELHIQPVTDLKTAITLNEKLLYVKDLFNGYSLAYSEAIEILNRFKTFEEADQYLKNNYAIKNNWESKPETTEKFYGLLRRRYV